MKTTFAAHTFRARTFAPGSLAGAGEIIPPIPGPYTVAAVAMYAAGSIAGWAWAPVAAVARVFAPGTLAAAAHMPVAAGDTFTAGAEEIQTHQAGAVAGGIYAPGAAQGDTQP